MTCVHTRAFLYIVSNHGLLYPTTKKKKSREISGTDLEEVVLDLGFTALLTSKVVSVAFYGEREKSEKFCSEALISA